MTTGFLAYTLSLSKSTRPVITFDWIAITFLTTGTAGRACRKNEQCGRDRRDKCRMLAPLTSGESINSGDKMPIRDTGGKLARAAVTVFTVTLAERSRITKPARAMAGIAITPPQTARRANTLVWTITSGRPKPANQSRELKISTDPG